MSGESGATPKRPHVLIVDDDEELRAVLAEALEQEGLSVSTVGDGLQAVRFLEEAHPPDLILLDLIMPVMNGWQFCSVQRSDPRWASIPVVALSAAAKKDPASPYYIEVADILAKPVQLQELLAKIGPFVFGA